MVALQVLLLGSFLLVFGAALVAVPLVILLVAVGFVAWLLLYLTPFLVVVADEPLLVAFRRSLRLTTSSVQPLAFVVVYALLVAAISLPTSVLANLGIGGVLAAAALTSNFGLFLSVLAVVFNPGTAGGGRRRRAVKRRHPGHWSGLTAGPRVPSCPRETATGPEVTPRRTFRSTCSARRSPRRR